MVWFGLQTGPGGFLITYRCVVREGALSLSLAYMYIIISLTLGRADPSSFKTPTQITTGVKASRLVPEGSGQRETA
jgi:hypothetical protein